MKRTRSRLAYGFAAGVLVVLAFAGLGYGTLQRLQSTGQDVTHGLQVVVAADELGSAIARGVAARRGYVLTRDAALLESGRAALVEIPAKLERLSALTSRVPGHAATLERLRQLVSRRVTTFETSLGAGPDLDGDVQRRVTLEGASLNREIDDLLRGLVAEEGRLLEESSRGSRRAERRSYLFLSASTLLALLALLTAVSGARRSLEVRDRLTEERDRFFTLSLDLLCIAGFDGYLKQLNPVWSRVLGWSEDELRARPYAEFVHPEDRAATLAAAERLSNGEEVVSFENRYRTRDGSFRWLLWTATLSLEKELVYAVARDITERKIQEAALAEVTGRLTGVLDGATQISIVATDPNGTITVFNRGAERMLGWSASEMVGLKTPEVFHDAAEVEARAAQLTVELGHPVAGFEVFVARARLHEFEEREWTYVRKDGSRLQVTLAVTALQGPGERPGGFLGVAKDITERRQVERMKDEFVSTVSHELRTPLTSIRGSLGLILGGAAGPIAPPARSLVEIAYRNSERLVRLINEILDLEKIESGKMTFRTTSLDLAALARQAAEGSEGFARERGVSLSVVGAPVLVSGDPDRLVQVLMNLLSNAIKHSPSGAAVEVVVERDGRAARVSVSDRGTGIPPEFHHRIFQRFAQADGADTRQPGGTGLGLSISKAIAEGHGGTLTFRSTPGEPTTFVLQLPVREELVPAAAAGEGRPRVLVCEDDRDIATLLAFMLGGAGLQADVAGSAREARLLLSRHAYAAMTLDLRLPDEDGLAFLRSLRGDEATRGLPVVVVSVCAEEGREAVNGDVIGIVDWLTKPIDHDRLLAAVAHGVWISAGRRPRVLHVEDDGDTRSVVSAVLGGRADLSVASSLEEARRCLREQVFDLVILDLGLPDGSGLEVMPTLAPTTPVLIFSGHDPGPEVASQVEATLVKTRTSNDRLLQKILALAHTGGAANASDRGEP